MLVNCPLICGSQGWSVRVESGLAKRISWIVEDVGWVHSVSEVNLWSSKRQEEGQDADCENAKEEVA